MGNKNQTVGIVGASGWLGQHLSQALIARDWKVVGYSRSDKTSDDLEWRQWDGGSEIDLSGIDALINLAGEPIDQRWTKKRKEEFRRSRVTVTENLSAATKESKIEIFLNASAIGYYGDRGDEVLTEKSLCGEGYLAMLCQEWEVAADTLSNVRLCYLRTGVVLGKGGRAWKKIDKIFACGLGGKLGHGKQWMPWIHLEDEIAAVIHCLENKIAGPVNLVAPEPVRNLEFTKALGAAYDRPTLMAVPGFALKLALGEFATEGILASARVIPAVLEESGFTFRFRTIAEAFADLTK